ncbi:MAG: tetratricopeptide repeat protein [Ferruginibacter sp.]
MIISIIIFAASSCNSKDASPGTAYLAQEKQLKDLVVQYPDSLILKENLVQYYRENNNYSRAIAEVEAALKGYPDNDRFLIIKATLHFEIGDTTNAITTFEKAISIQPKPEYILSLGSLYAQTSNAAALQLGDALLEAPAGNYRSAALFIKGLYYSYSGNKQKALPYFDSCVKINYRDMPAYREKAICLYDLKEYSRALDVLKQAVTVQKSFDEGYYWMGRCYEKLNKKTAAAESYETALQLDPDYREAIDALQSIK